MLDAALVQRHYDRARAERWALPLERFRAALERSVRHRFGPAGADNAELRRYLDALHAEDLALACACAEGTAAAWDHFVLQFRPVLYRTAGALRVPGDARELADSIYADLYGLEERDGVRRSLFTYFHGRSSLAGWLRSVLAQRAVDRARSASRLVSLPEDPEAAERVLTARANPDSSGKGTQGQDDPTRTTLVAMVRAVLVAAIGALDPKSRLRLALYYTRGCRLAEIGRLLGESEATASRKLDRTRKELRAEVGARLQALHGLDEAQAELAVSYAVDDQVLDLERALPVGDG